MRGGGAARLSLFLKVIAYFPFSHSSRNIPPPYEVFIRQSINAINQLIELVWPLLVVDYQPKVYPAGATASCIFCCTRPCSPKRKKSLLVHAARFPVESTPEFSGSDWAPFCRESHLELPGPRIMVARRSHQAAILGPSRCPMMPWWER